MPVSNILLNIWRRKILQLLLDFLIMLYVILSSPGADVFDKDSILLSSSMVIGELYDKFSKV